MEDYIKQLEDEYKKQTGNPVRSVIQGVMVTNPMYVSWLCELVHARDEIIEKMESERYEEK